MKEEIPQLYAMCGRGARSTLRVLRPGLAATEIAVSPLPGNPTGIWTIKRSYSDDFDAYIIVAFTNATLVSRDASRRSDGHVTATEDACLSAQGCTAPSAAGVS